MNAPRLNRLATVAPAALLISLFATGCAGLVEVQRKQPALITFKSGPPSLGIVSIEEDAPLANNTPAGDVRGTLLNAISDLFKANNAGPVGTHLGAAGDVTLHLSDLSDLKTSFVAKLPKLPPLDAAANESLIELIEVNKWRVEETGGGKGIPADKQATLLLTFSTWTHDGTLLLAERVQATGTANRTGPVDVAIYPDDDSARARDYKATTGSLKKQSGDLAELFTETVRAAVGLHYAPFFEHSITESFFFDGGGPNADGLAKGKAGDWKAAQQSWTQVYTADPKNAGALYDAGVAALVQGDEETAASLISKAVALNDKTVWEWTLKPLKARLAAKKALP